jgi:hypothetical protein
MSDQTTPVTPPSTAARLRPAKIRRNNKRASLSGGDVNLESLDEVENVGESTLNTNDEGKSLIQVLSVSSSEVINYQTYRVSRHTS